MESVSVCLCVVFLSEYIVYWRLPPRRVVLRVSMKQDWCIAVDDL